MPRNATYTNRWFKTHKQFTLYKGTWCTKRRLGAPCIQGVKVFGQLVLDANASDHVARDGEYEYRWTEVAATSAAIAYYCRCSHCGIFSSRTALGLELVTNLTCLERARAELQTFWQSYEEQELGHVLNSLGVEPMCWRCIFRMSPDQFTGRTVVTELPNEDLTERELLDLTREIVSDCRDHA